MTVCSHGRTAYGTSRDWALKLRHEALPPDRLTREWVWMWVGNEIDPFCRRNSCSVVRARLCQRRAVARHAVHPLADRASPVSVHVAAASSAPLSAGRDGALGPS